MPAWLGYGGQKQYEIKPRITHKTYDYKIPHTVGNFLYITDRRLRKTRLTRL